MDYSNGSHDENVKELREAAAIWRLADARCGENQRDDIEESLAELSRAYWLVTQVVSPIVEPSRLIEHDLEELRSRPYLADYFSSIDV